MAGLAAVCPEGDAYVERVAGGRASRACRLVHPSHLRSHRGGTGGCRNRADRQTRPCGERRERLHRPHRSYRWSEKRRRVRLQHGVTRQIAIVFVARFAGPRTPRAAMICRLPYNDESGLTGLVRPRSSVRLVELVTTLQVSEATDQPLAGAVRQSGQRIWFPRSPAGWSVGRGQPDPDSGLCGPNRGRRSISHTRSLTCWEGPSWSTRHSRRNGRPLARPRSWLEAVRRSGNRREDRW